MKNKTFLANCALVLCAVIWGMNFIFQKQASQHLGAFTFISLRYYLGVLSLLPLFFYMRRRKAFAALEAGEEVERWHGRRFWRPWEPALPTGAVRCWYRSVSM